MTERLRDRGPTPGKEQFAVPAMSSPEIGTLRTPEAAMNVLLAGASGAIGVPLTRHLIGVGHRVVGLSRTPINHDTLRALGAETVVADAIDREAVLRAVDGLQADAVIHQLTALKNASPRLRADDPTSALRVRGTSNLLDVASLVGARRFLTQSLIFGYGYGDHGTRELTEHDPFGYSQGGHADPESSRPGVGRTAGLRGRGN